LPVLSTCAHDICLTQLPPPQTSTRFPYTTLFRSQAGERGQGVVLMLAQHQPLARLARQEVVERQEPGHSLEEEGELLVLREHQEDRKSTRLNSSHDQISYAVFCLKKKKAFGA